MQISPQHYALAWYQMVKDAPGAARKKISKSVLAHLHKTARLGWLADILRSLEDLEYRDRGAERVVVTSALKLTREQAQKLVADILKTRDAVVEQKTDASLLAGARIETKSKRWDVSLRGQLNALRSQLAT